MAGALDFTRQFSLAARAVASLAPRFDLAAFVDVAGEHIKVFVIEASSFGTMRGSAAATAPTPSALGTAAPAGATRLLGPGLTLRWSGFAVFTHEPASPILAYVDEESCVEPVARLGSNRRPGLSRLLDFAFFAHQQVAQHRIRELQFRLQFINVLRLDGGANQYVVTLALSVDLVRQAPATEGSASPQDCWPRQSPASGA